MDPVQQCTQPIVDGTGGRQPLRICMAGAGDDSSLLTTQQCRVWSRNRPHSVLTAREVVPHAAHHAAQDCWQQLQHQAGRGEGRQAVQHLLRLLSGVK